MFALRFHIDIQLVDGACQLSVFGELDLATAPTLRERLDAVGTSSPVVVDLAGVSFLDARGLRVLIDAHRRWSGGLLLVRPSPATRRLFELTANASLLELPDQV